MRKTRQLTLLAVLAACLPAYAQAGSATNKSFESKYKTTAHTCMAGQCDDQAEAVSAAFFVTDKQVHVYSGDNKGKVLPFGRRNASADGKSVWIVPTPAGFDETYAQDEFTITHHYVTRPDGTCAVSVSVVKAPSGMRTTYKTDMESCKVADGNIFAAR